MPAPSKPKTLEQARREMAAQSTAARQIAKQQEAAARGAGFSRSPGFDPAPRARRTRPSRTACRRPSR
jgi:hypothetical protein